MSRTMLVGGLGALRDELVVAALAGAALDAVALPSPTDAGLALARALGNHGQCNPGQYPVGSVLEAARRAGLDAATFAARHVWVVPSSCGPCRLAAFPLEWRRVLDGAGLGALPFEFVDQHSFIPALSSGGGGRTAGLGLVMALVAGDGLEALGHQLRPWVVAPEDLDALLMDGAREVSGALRSRQSVLPALHRVAVRAWTLPVRLDRALPRVLLVGEPWTTLTDGDPSYDIARRLARLGAEVEAPLVVDWLSALAWQRSGAVLVPDDERLAARRAVRSVAAGWRLVAKALQLPVRRPSPARLGALAGPWYPPSIRGGSSFLEVGRALAAAEDHAAHVVVSLKPFGCLPSASLSDGVLGPLLARAPEGPAFLALETSGDSQASVDSRLELALHGATLRAWGEFEAVCRTKGLSTAGGLEVLARLGPAALRHQRGQRMFTCTAAELLDDPSLGAPREAAPTFAS